MKELERLSEATREMVENVCSMMMLVVCWYERHAEISWRRVLT